MEEIKISEKFKIYKTKYDGKFSINEFLKFINLNDKLVIHTNEDSVWVEIVCECFSSINFQIKNEIEKIIKKKLVNYAEHYWVYTQKKGFDLKWMHQHIYVHPPGRSYIFNDWTFTFYLQIPENLNNQEGCIVFETEDKKHHTFLPEVGDIFIFPADLRHTAIPTPNQETKRIVYAGSICTDIEMQNEKKNIL